MPETPLEPMATGYAYAWEFHVPASCVAAFERHYGPEGTWVGLFRRAPGFIETLLLKDDARPGRYVTVDRWQSEAAYQDFRARFSDEYSVLDQQCEALASDEIFLGSFSDGACR